MRITCPQCQFQGLIDTGPLAFDTRVVCVQCGTTFEALLVGGEIKTKLPVDAHEILPLQPIMPVADPEVSEPVSEPESETVSEAEDVLVLPQTSAPSEHLGEPAPVHEDVLSVELADAWAVAQGKLAARDESENGFDDSLPVVSDSREDASADEELSSETAACGDKQDFASTQPQVEASVDVEKHGLGMRLMRISPLWLLVCGTTFVSVIILCNQLVKPAEPEQRAAASYSVPDNRASNQSLTTPSVPTSNKAGATSVQDSSQVAAAAPVELKNEAKAVEPSVEAPKQSEPLPAAAEPKIVPAVETKSEPPVSLPQSQDNGSGGFTIQVGSYNVIEQANERVSGMRAAGLDARVVAVELPKRGTWYRVQSGRFSSREEAQRYGNEARDKRAVDNFIIADAEGGK
jgi:cell division protein FtsN